MTRLGVCAYANIYLKHGSNDYAFQPFVELNWIRNTVDCAIMMDNMGVYQKGADNLGEVRLRIESKPDGRLSVGAHIGHQFGSGS